MEIIKQLQKTAIELYLMISVVFYWVWTSYLFNPIAILLLVVLTILIVGKNEILGVIISSLFLILNLFMVLALISELKKFSVFNTNAETMLLVGATYLGLNIIVSIIMLRKWVKASSFRQTNINIDIA